MASSSTCLSGVLSPWRRWAAVPAVVAVLALASVTPTAAAASATKSAPPRVIATIGVGDGYAALALNPRNGTVYVANNGSKTVSVINGRSDKVVSTIHIAERSGLGRPGSRSAPRPATSTSATTPATKMPTAP